MDEVLFRLVLFDEVMTAVFCVLFALIGLVLGGFLRRFAYAFPRRAYAEVVRPTCHACGSKLSARYSLPIIGAFLSRGRCPVCGEKRGMGSFFSEVVYAITLCLLYFYYGISVLFFLYAFVAAVLLVLSLVDLDIKEVSHLLLLLLLVVGTVIFVLSFFPSVSLASTVWWEHIVGAFCVSLPLFIVMMVTGGGVGGGDIKLMFCLGYLLGYKLVLVAFLFGIVIAAVVSVVLMLSFGKNGKYELPLVPFLSMGTLIALLWGETLITALF